MKYSVSIDLKQLPLQIRNEVVKLVKSSGSYYSLENQIISSDFRTMQKIISKI